MSSIHPKKEQKISTQEYYDTSERIQLLNNKVYGLSLSDGHHLIFFDQGFQKIAG